MTSQPSANTFGLRLTNHDVVNKHTIRLLHKTSQFLSDSTIFEFSYGYSN